MILAKNSKFEEDNKKKIKHPRTRISKHKNVVNVKFKLSIVEKKIK
jgi:hypothetical protein